MQGVLPRTSVWNAGAGDIDTRLFGMPGPGTIPNSKVNTGANGSYMLNRPGEMRLRSM